MEPMLSKSRYLNGLQCPKLLWLASNERERIPELDAATQLRSDVNNGHQTFHAASSPA